MTVHSPPAAAPRVTTARRSQGTRLLPSAFCLNKGQSYATSSVSASYDTTGVTTSHDDGEPTTTTTVKSRRRRPSRRRRRQRPSRRPRRPKQRRPRRSANRTTTSTPASPAQICARVPTPRSSVSSTGSNQIACGLPTLADNETLDQRRRRTADLDGERSPTFGHDDRRLGEGDHRQGGYTRSLDLGQNLAAGQMNNAHDLVSAWFTEPPTTVTSRTSSQAFVHELGVGCSNATARATALVLGRRLRPRQLIRLPPNPAKYLTQSDIPYSGARGALDTSSQSGRGGASVGRDAARRSAHR